MLDRLLSALAPSDSSRPPASRRLLQLGELLLRGLCLAFCLLLCWQAVERFRAQQVHTAMLVVESGVPNLTVCPSQDVSESEPGAHSRWQAGNISQEEYVRQADRPLGWILARCFAGESACCLPSCESDQRRLGHWSEVLVPGPTRPLLCHRLQLNDSDAATVRLNGGLSMDFFVPPQGPDTGGLFDVYPHGGARPVLLYGVGPRSAAVTASVEDGTPRHVALRVATEAMRSVSRRRRPCRRRRGYSQQHCHISCWHSAAASAVGCRALGFDPSPAAAVAPCGNASSLSALYSALYDQPAVAPRCHCPPACLVVQYRGSEQRRFYPAAHHPTVTVVLSQWATVMQEQLATSPQQLASELGGLLGLLLGVSAWTLAALLWRAVRAVCRPATGQPKGQPQQPGHRATVVTVA